MLVKEFVRRVFTTKAVLGGALLTHMAMLVGAKLFFGATASWLWILAPLWLAGGLVAVLVLVTAIMLVIASIE